MNATRAKSEKKSADMANKDGLPVFARRFVQARERAGMTLEQVAVAADIDDPACVRMSQYQRGIHTPRFNVAQKIAQALKVPVEYLYSPDDLTAELLLQWHPLKISAKQDIVRLLSGHSAS